MPRRIRVVGNSGSGKSTLARAIAARLDLPHLELDSVQHRRDWEQAPEAEFQAEVRAFRDRSEAQAGGWVVDGNYRSRLGDVLDGADCVVWLDFPRWRVMSRVTRRTLGRLVVHKQLWNGNREQWRNLVRRDPDDNLLLWAWTQHAGYREQYGEPAASDPRWVTLRTPAQVRQWLDRLG